MDLYTIWADKEGDITDLDWVNGMKSFFDHLISEGKMESYRITRCKMGFRSITDMPKWMIKSPCSKWINRYLPRRPVPAMVRMVCLAGSNM